MKKLSPEQAELIWLHVRDELTFEEIGTVLNIPAKTAASRYYKARDILQNHLQKEK